MKKAGEDGEGCYLSLLNQLYTPRDEVLGSQAQRLMTRRTKTVLPVTEEQLQPQPVETKKIQKRLQYYREHAAKEVLQSHSQAIGTLEIGRRGKNTK